MRTPGYAARHLDIDHLVRHPVGTDHFVDQCLPLRGAVRVGNPDRLQAAVQARKMLRTAERLAAVVRDDLIDAIAKDKAAVEDRNAGFGQRGQGTIEVDDGVGHEGFRRWRE
ncbi:hypothetical protein D3C81_1298690 [compost metagenome]